MQQSGRPKLSIVVPASSEAARVGACVERATVHLAAQAYSFEAEVAWIAQPLGLRVAELPMIWADDRQSKVHPICESLRMIVAVAAIRGHDARGACEASSAASDASDPPGRA
jgi:hypothetical protein